MKKKVSNTTSAYISIMIAMSIWACSFLFTQEALKSFNPITAVTLRMTMAACFLGCYGLLSRSLQKVGRKDIPLFLLAGFAQPFCYFICEAYGLTMVSATVASVVLSTIPLFSPIFAWLIVRERVTFTNLMGIILSLVGVFFIVFERQQMVVRPLGLLCLCISVLAAIIYSSLLRKIPSSYSNVSIVFYVHLASLCFFYPTFLIFDLKHWGERPILPSSVICLVVLALFASMLGYILFCKSVRVIGITKSNAFCNVMPGVTALAVWLVFGEQLPLIKWVGIAIVITGLFVSQMRTRKVP